MSNTHVEIIVFKKTKGNTPIVVKETKDVKEWLHDNNDVIVDLLMLDKLDQVYKQQCLT